jgi:putative flavoprotein involved in K+ transport
MVEHDRKTIDGLIARGFKFDDGEDGAGHQWKVRTRYGGYYLDAGCSQLIIDGEVGLLQYDRIERFVEGGALLKDGSVKPADLIVLATGFVPQEVVVTKLLGEEIAKKIGPVWGFGADCRTYSRYVALQIKAIEEGILPRKP